MSLSTDPWVVRTYITKSPAMHACMVVLAQAHLNNFEGQREEGDRGRGPGDEATLVPSRQGGLHGYSSGIKAV